MKNTLIQNGRASTWKMLLLIFILAGLNNRCTYYRVAYVPAVAVQPDTCRETPFYYILHQGSNTWQLKNTVFNDAKNEISAELDHLPAEHEFYKTTNLHSTNRYYHRNVETIPVGEVHIYVSEYQEGPGKLVRIPLQYVIKIELYEKARGATFTSQYFSTLGFIFGLFPVYLLGAYIYFM